MTLHMLILLSRDFRAAQYKQDQFF